MNIEEKKVIFINGFGKDDVLKIMRAVKSVMDNPQEIAFSMGTQTNRDWKVSDLIDDVAEEHEYMRKNPPQAPKS